MRALLPILLSLLACSVVSLSSAAALPEGFRLDKVAATQGFLTSLVPAPEGIIYYTTRNGEIRRLTHGLIDEKIATVDTANEGNAALLGLAIAPDGKMIVHYVRPDLQADVISSIDPETLEETVIAEISCKPTPNCSSEHRGGNPHVADDGTIFVGIGDYGVQSLAQKDYSNAGKIHAISPEGEISVFAKGLRNPFEVVWDPIHERLVLSDNGPIGDDEMNFATEGSNLGWPLTMGNFPAVEGMVSPAWVFDETIAPTGLVLPGEEVPYFGGGILVTAFISKTLYFFPSLGGEEGELSAPVIVVDRDVGGLIDVAVGPGGEIYLGSLNAIYHLIPPLIGDVDGDGKLLGRDYLALREELADGDGESVWDVGAGSFPGTWGADVDQNGVVNERDLDELARLVFGRRRGVRRR